MKIDNWTVNPKVTEDVIVEAVERYRSSLDNPGFCLGSPLIPEPIRSISPQSKRNSDASLAPIHSPHGNVQLVDPTGGRSVVRALFGRHRADRE